MKPPLSEPVGQAPSTAMIYELLDAHHDTAQLPAELASDVRWEAHLEYLRALQRRGRELVAQMSDKDRAT